MKYTLLDNIQSPKDMKQLNKDQLCILSAEVRDFIVNSVASTGGHLASNLGTVELIVAMHRVFDSPKDKIVFDVGHQSYAHKVLTGRRKNFNSLRKKGGLSGFPKSSESEHDAFISGHSSTSISVALGIAKAFQLSGDSHHAIAVIGDGAFTGGLAYEALNNAGRSRSNIIVILNHNDMSISKNVGAFARYLSRIRSTSKYFHFKTSVENVLDKTPLVGRPLKSVIEGSKSMLKRMIYKSNFFEELGFRFLGPIDGHDMGQLLEALQYSKELKRPVVIQVETTKGKGYTFAEKNPGGYHATGTFNPLFGTAASTQEFVYSDIMGIELKDIADENDKVCAITAAMKYGTGLQYFSQSHRERFFDVGIAEAHAATFAGGLASQGMIPVFAVYSSFMQRSYDQLIHDLSIEEQHVVLAVDRAGIVGEDGETHQGIFDVAYTTHIPKITVYSPEGYDELRYCLRKAVLQDSGVVCVRYPRGKGERTHTLEPTANYSYINKNSDILIISYGRLFSNCYTAANEIENETGKTVSLIKLTRLTGLDAELKHIIAVHKNVLFYEEGIRCGGIGEQLAADLLASKYRGNYSIHGIDNFVPQSSVKQAFEELQFDVNSIKKQIKTAIERQLANG